MAEDKAPMKVTGEDESNPLLDDIGTSPFGDDDKPKTRKPRSDAGKPRGPRRGPRSSSLSKKISSAVAMVAAGVATVDAFDSAIILHNADKLGQAWAPVVEQNPKIAAFFASLEKGGVWGSAIFTSLSVALPIIVHHAPASLPAPLRAVAVSMIPPDIYAKMAAQNGNANAAYSPNGNANATGV